ncbi:tubulin-tyrosine ligase family domain-containing protein [Ditylenchus destructor]|uniref:Tubulin-tyrosine ligase family domain-containing protein n=1 Tax=Ditylenchus destructor TaxID=166010 RepID=A0AAD4R5V0_9BILA|nr:tubulin-tyrosine ligase family domain-containing protein [Ditylenchus destructor]
MNEKPNYEQFLEVHEAQLLSSRVPQHFWPNLFEKLKKEQLDAGDFFQIIAEENEAGGTNNWSVATTRDVASEDPNNIFLIDHAWTFRPNTARMALQEVEGLKERLMNVFGIKMEDFKDSNSCSDYIGSEGEDEPMSTSKTSANKDKVKMGTPKGSGSNLSDFGDNVSLTTSLLNERLFETILDEMWKYAQTYTIRFRKNIINEQDVPVWYLPDEFGMRIGHSRSPNVRMVPFFYVFQNMAYNLLFPLADVGHEEEIRRNFLDNKLYMEHPGWYDILMHPWRPLTAPDDGDIIFADKSLDYFNSGRVPDDIPSAELQSKCVPFYKDGTWTEDVPIKLYVTDSQLINNFEKVKMEIVHEPFEADVLWLRDHFHQFKQLSENRPSALVNQFPYESILTVKDLFAACVQDAFKDSKMNENLEWEPDWFPTTFNLNLELPQFFAYFQRRQQRNMENTWIIKPWNLARGLDTFVTKNLNCIIRLAESGPKIACKYIHNPVLFRRPDNGNLVKFDLRYIVLVKSFQPLELAIYDKFWIRFAVNEYSLNNLDDIFTHMSVHNYTDSSKVLNMKCEEFVSHLEKLHPKIKWADVQGKINHVIKEVFQTVSKCEPPRGIAPNVQSRAMYGLDLMLHWTGDYQSDVNVKFIEANFMPDCERACQFYPDFADTIFQYLFMGKTSENIVAL